VPLINTYSFTSQGPRPTNQDCILLEQIPDLGLLCCVADGVGGNQGGETASKLAVGVFFEHVSNKQDNLKDCATEAHHIILQQAALDEKLLGMATTVASILVKGTELKGVNCGDSRVYLLRDNGLKQLSKDHTEVAKLLESGKLTKETAIDYPRKHILDSALGGHKALQIEEFSFELKDKDRVILITDGVYSVISKKEIRDLSLANNNLDDFCSAVINAVINRKTSDNFSLIAIEIK